MRIEESEVSSPIEKDEEKEDQDTKTRKYFAKRKRLPDHLERTDIVLTPDPKCPSCGGENFRKIADDVSETLEYIPSSFKVNRYIRPRCACINCETIVQADP
jgi:transposase